MEFNWFGLWTESKTPSSTPTPPSSPSSASENYADYGLAAVFALAVLWGLLGPSHKSYKKEVTKRYVSRKHR